ncbi:hypothetical protein F4821DRAFT_222738 [Hypoxylon rubiginosum]|uniref:Uncharacterized protein n=1 Tax=Hypoxylon rubiginosum TaxID=110542 RepID=A0ACC0DKN5_9PEZI|nr:hypothetical protein F4821DRAFT_222738 [Hypoxylon rubiginosum]
MVGGMLHRVGLVFICAVTAVRTKGPRHRLSRQGRDARSPHERRLEYVNQLHSMVLRCALCVYMRVLRRQGQRNNGLPPWIWCVGTHAYHTLVVAAVGWYVNGRGRWTAG